MKQMPKQKVADVTEVEVLGQYRVRLAFSDGTAGVVDLAWVKERDFMFEPRAPEGPGVLPPRRGRP